MEEANEKIDQIIHELELRLIKIFGQDLKKIPVEEYLEEFRAYGDNYYYNYFSDHLRKRFDWIRSQYGEAGYNLYHKYALALNVKNSLNDLNKKKFPLDINFIYKQWVERVIEDFIELDDTFYNIGNDLFIKDMGVVSFRIIPVGAQVLCETGVARSFLKSWNPISICRNILFLLIKMKRLRPFVEIHTDNRWLHEFNPEGWNRTYLRVAYYLKENPIVKGMIGGSWFYDPELEKVSPHLIYLRKIPQENGAVVFKINTTEHCINDALLSSKTRRNLYEKGEYTPSRHIIIWCRDDLIKWAESYEKNQGQ